MYLLDWGISRINGEDVRVGKFALFAFLGTFLFFWMFFMTRNFSQSRQLDNIMDLFVISFLSYPFLIALGRVNVKIYCF